jgi:hypothetical protein
MFFMGVLVGEELLALFLGRLGDFVRWFGKGEGEIGFAFELVFERIYLT